MANNDIKVQDQSVPPNSFNPETVDLGSTIRRPMFGIKDGANETFGSKSDILWDGTSAASAISLFRYIASKSNVTATAISTTVTNGLLQVNGTVQVVNGSINVTSGNINVSGGNINVTSGNINVSGGFINVASGNLAISALPVGANNIGKVSHQVGGVDLSTANPFPVSQANTDIRPASANVNIVDSGSATAAGQNGSSLITGTATVGSVYTQTVNTQTVARVLVKGTWVGTLQFEGSIDSGVTWTPMTAKVMGVGYSQTSITANGHFLLDIAGLTNFRLRCTAYTSGTAVIVATMSQAPGATEIINPLRLIDNATGNSPTIRGASSAANTQDNSLVVQISPNSNVTLSNTSVTQIFDINTNQNIRIKASGASAVNVDPALVITFSPNTPLPIGNNIIGSMQGRTGWYTQALTVTASSYTIGYCIGGLITFPNIVNANILTALLHSIHVNCGQAGINCTYKLYLFHTIPTLSAFTDHTACAINAAEWPFVLGVLSLSSYDSGLGNHTHHWLDNIIKRFHCTGTNLYAALVLSSGSLTYTVT